jgi:hypothetical protein
MSACRCACGYEAASSEDLADHLGEQFIPADDTDAGGQVHAEAAREQGATELARAGWRCLCGFGAPDLAGFDAHLLAVFTPPDRIGADARRHAQQPHC